MLESTVHFFNCPHGTGCPPAAAAAADLFESLAATSALSGADRRAGARPMTNITEQDLIDSIAGALQYISYYHPADFIEHLAEAYEAEAAPAAKDAIAQILTNSKMCAEGK